VNKKLQQGVVLVDKVCVCKITPRLQKIITILKFTFMKKILLLLASLLLVAAGCATQKTTASNAESIPVYYTGNDEPAAVGVSRYNEQF
jgi:hypothetical protein